MEDRDKRIVGKMLAVINHGNTSDDEAVAAFRAIRRVSRRLGLPLEETVGEELAQERDRWKRAFDRLQRQVGKRMEAANAARTKAAETHAMVVARVIQAITRENPGISTDGIAAELGRRKVLTAWGDKTWTRMQVHRVMRRAGRW